VASGRAIAIDQDRERPPWRSAIVSRTRASRGSAIAGAPPATAGFGAIVVSPNRRRAHRRREARGSIRQLASLTSRGVPAQIVRGHAQPRM
jgi:hypothetical protein